MQNSQTQHGQGGSFNTQSEQETENKESYPLLTRNKIPNTEFYVVGNKDIGYKVTWGKYSFNDTPLETEEKAIQWSWENHWKIILHVVAIALIQHEDKHHPEKKEQK